MIYGNKEEPLSIHVEEKALVKALSGGHFMNSVVMIDAGAAPVRTLPKDVQFHPVTDRPLHVDFLRISEHAKVQVAVPIHFVDEDKSKGIKRGGVLNQVRHELELICDAAEIPEEIVISLAGLDIGDSLHISAVTLPKGVESAITDRDFTIATIVASSAVKEDDSETSAPTSADVPLVGEEEAEGEGEAAGEETSEG